MKTDYKTINVEIKDGVAVFTLNNPPVNQLSEHFVIEMADAFQEAFKDAGVKAVVLTGSGKNFIAGADITQIRMSHQDELLPAA
jgi:enoyl-CoA hydratase/carnithine racemase